MNAEAMDVFTRWRKQCADNKGLLFFNVAGGRIASVKTAWLALLDVASIEGFRWHDPRQTFASKLVQRGVNLMVVRDLLGHGNFPLTLRYDHLELR